jgi:hypothetical protein
MCVQTNIAATFKDMDSLERGKAIVLYENAGRATSKQVCQCDEALVKLREAYPAVHTYVLNHAHALSTWASSYKTRADFKKVTSNIVGTCQCSACVVCPMFGACIDGTRPSSLV